ncbi:hypothetical protein [Candidatus Formimonas warabiya]|uniref:hypothetical protein n=1 Tax=Formimonas warabiya TaxID=1761012 RepID=UPI0011D0DA36|nr:hypothetical protein [Candidatus Formimonas warabiya]
MAYKKPFGDDLSGQENNVNSVARRVSMAFETAEDDLSTERTKQRGKDEESLKKKSWLQRLLG